MDKEIVNSLSLLNREFGEDRVEMAIEAVKNFSVEIPSWIFGPFGGGRFGEYMPPGAARTISEKLDDAALVHRLTDATENVAMHILWDFSKDGSMGDYAMAEKVGQAALDRGIKIGSISPTYFLKGSQRGSLSAVENETREKYIAQTVLGGCIAKELGGGLLTIWLPDGSLYPGQTDIRKAIASVEESLRTAFRDIDPEVTVLIEYKVFEPGTYSTTIPDWGTAYMLATELGTNAGVLVDLGHHYHGTNIEQIVASLINTGMKCGFHFNTRYAADDDHAVEPNGEMARIFYELVSGGVIATNNPAKEWAYMIDQCSARENRIYAILHSVDSLQLSLAKAVLVDQLRLEALQNRDEIILANRFLNNALIHADVRPIVAAARLAKNLPADPIAAFIESGYQQKIESERR